MTDTEAGFLHRRRLREQSRALTKHLVLGWGLSFVMLFLGAYHYFAVVGASDSFWLALMYAGALAGTLTLLVPVVWMWPEAALHKVGNVVGTALMISILAAIYCFVVWPTGVVLRAVRGSAPIYRWSEAVPAGAEGWIEKRMPPDLPAIAGHKVSMRPRRSGLGKLLLFFAKGGNVIFLPVLIILVSLGLALFFLQSSALAPLIYTLF